MTIAVDFDGTIVEHRYPQIGEEIPFATATLKMLINERHRLIYGRYVKGSSWRKLWNGAGNGVWNSMPSTGTIRKKTSHTPVFHAK